MFKSGIKRVMCFILCGMCDYIDLLKSDGWRQNVKGSIGGKVEMVERQRSTSEKLHNIE